jgi:hypothetical protein
MAATQALLYKQVAFTIMKSPNWRMDLAVTTARLGYVLAFLQ